MLNMLSALNLVILIVIVVHICIITKTQCVTMRFLGSRIVYEQRKPLSGCASSQSGHNVFFFMCLCVCFVFVCFVLPTRNMNNWLVIL